jgi:hypothetical protein
MPVTLPLLHVVQSAAQMRVLDARVTVAAVVAFAVSMAVIWRPDRALRRRRTRRYAARAAMSALVFLAVLPAVLPYDHLFFSDAHAGGDESVHVAHCHASPGSCSDVPMTSGPGQLLLSDPLILAPAMLALLLIVAEPVLRGITRRPELRPPTAYAVA